MAISPEEYLEFIVDKTLPTSETFIQITNYLEFPVAYRIKTSAPRDFLISEPEGTVGPKGKVVIGVLYKVTTESFLKFHKFLVQTVVVEEGDPNWKSTAVHEYKLCSRFSSKKIVVEEKVPDEEKEVLEEVEEKVEVQEIVKEIEKEKWSSHVFAKKFNILHLVIAFSFGWVLSCLITPN